MRKFLRHRNGEFHVDREVIGPCPITNALAFQLANTGGHKDVVNRYLRHAGAGWPRLIPVGGRARLVVEWRVPRVLVRGDDGTLRYRLE